MANKLKVYFLLFAKYEDELACSEDMQQAFELCRQNHMVPEWIGEEQCLTGNFEKNTVLVFEKFEGAIYERVLASRCLSIVGPRCIITSLLESLPIPNNKAPVYNMAMYNLVVTSSNYTVEEKRKIKEKVELMGGIYRLHITNNVTHLITNSVRTQKYIAAYKKQMPVMSEAWVESVWEASQNRNIKAIDPEFQSLKCLTFQGLTFSSTGFNQAERAGLQQLIDNNGGSLSGKMTVGRTHFLICKPGVKSDKYAAAIKANIPCVIKEYIYDSYKEQYALPENDYLIKLSTSTPTKPDAPLNLDFSTMSSISNIPGMETNTPTASVTSISDTINVSLFNKSQKQAQGKENQVTDVLTDINLMKQVKQAGPFLDGCSIFIAGFSPERRDIVCRILKIAGATRYDNVSDRVTQIIVGDQNAQDIKLLNIKHPGPPIVSSDWLIECIKQEQLINEEPYIVRTQSDDTLTPSSPLSKKGLTLLQHDTNVMPEAEHQHEPVPFKEDTMLIYMQRNNKSEEDTLAQLLAEGADIDTKVDDNCTKTKADETKPNETTSVTEEESFYPIFQGKSFQLAGYDELDHIQLTKLIEDLNGNVITNVEPTDYAIVPIISKQSNLNAKETVTDLWVLESHNVADLLRPQYYHRPITFESKSKPLSDCVITISGYTSYERKYLTTLLEQLGAVYQDKFARLAIAEKNVLASTHLICMEKSGNKYEAALRWKIPAVTNQWLLQCAKTDSKADENFWSWNEQGTASCITNDEKEPSDTSKISHETSFSSLKRDSEGRNKSNVSTGTKTPITANKSLKPLETGETSRSSLGQSFKDFLPSQNDDPVFHTPARENQAVGNVERRGEPIITMEDGTKIPLSELMQGLRDQGCFDTPSPVRKLAPYTPIRELVEKTKADFIDFEKVATPKNQPGSSQGTPVGNYIRGLKERNWLPSTPKNASTVESPPGDQFWNMKTPDTPLGQFCVDNPSRTTRKRWQHYINQMPDYYTERTRKPPERTLSTPLNVIKQRLWAWLLRDRTEDNPDVVQDLRDQFHNEVTENPDTTEKPPPTNVIETESQIEVNNQIEELKEMLENRSNMTTKSRSSLFRLNGDTPQANKPSTSTSGSPIAGINAIFHVKESQSDLVGWDEPMEAVPIEPVTETEETREFQLRKFMVSGLEQSMRQSCYNTIKSLGGEVSELTTYDTTATHLICSQPTRNEKILSSMAAGKYIVHYSYIQDSGEAGQFLDEELYEFGNPKSQTRLNALDIKTGFSVNSMHWWRTRCSETGVGAFHGVRAMISSKNKASLVKVIEAGGGTIVNATPPYTHNLDVTHCFIDPKQKNSAEFVPLAEQGVPCLNALYLSSYLNNRTSVKIDEFILPALQMYYS